MHALRLDQIATLSGLFTNLNHAQAERAKLVKNAQEVPQELEDRIFLLKSSMQELGVQFPEDADILPYVPRQKPETQPQVPMAAVPVDEIPPLVA